MPSQPKPKGPFDPLPANPLPTASVPVPPAGFEPPDARALLGSHPRQIEVAIAADVVDELRAFTDYDAVFGSSVPPVQRLATLLDFARKWRAQRDAAGAWNAYVRAQDALAWKGALDLLDELKPTFRRAAARQPSLAMKHPRLALFFDAHRQIAQRASDTKTKKKARRASEKAAPPEAGSDEDE